jgi:predicted  nucleic acid-binding Zn-ribbon protein
MVDTTTTTATPAETLADTVTKQTYDETKALAEERAAKLAAAEARLQAYETRERAQLQSYQPAMEGLVKELATEFSTPENKGHFDSFGDWTRNCHERPNLDTQMQLGTIIHACASKLKRTREEASVQSATAEQLASMAKENETLKENLATKEARIGELSTSLKEIQTNSEKLQLQLEKAGALKEKFDFSKATSREADAVKEENGIVTTTENASKGALGQVASVDPSAALFAFVNGNGAGASSRFMPSASNHSLLGAPSGSDIGIGSALRPM